MRRTLALIQQGRDPGRFHLKGNYAAKVLLQITDDLLIGDNFVAAKNVANVNAWSPIRSPVRAAAHDLLLPFLGSILLELVEDTRVALISRVVRPESTFGQLAKLVVNDLAGNDNIAELDLIRDARRDPDEQNDLGGKIGDDIVRNNCRIELAHAVRLNSDYSPLHLVHSLVIDSFRALGLDHFPAQAVLFLALDEDGIELFSESSDDGDVGFHAACSSGLTMDLTEEDTQWPSVGSAHTVQHRSECQE